MGRRAKGLLVGIVGGLVAALLLAPESGQRTRSRLQDRLRGVLGALGHGRGEHAGETTADEELRARVQGALEQRGLLDAGINLHVDVGVVHLGGTLARPELRGAILEAVKDLPGVTDVVDGLLESATSP